MRDSNEQSSSSASPEPASLTLVGVTSVDITDIVRASLTSRKPQAVEGHGFNSMAP